MPYEKRLSGGNPGCIMILLDQSGSMSAAFGANPALRKHEESARAVNRVLRELVLRCRGEGVLKDRCHLGVIGYGKTIGSALPGPLAGRDLVPASELARAPLRVDTVVKMETDPERGTISVEDKEPVWVEPVSSGGTPMADAMRMAHRCISDWIVQHPSSFPPLVINVTDGDPDDRDTGFQDSRGAASRLQELKTQDGNLLLLNAHISSTRALSIDLPASSAGLPDPYSRFLFEISSPLPDALRQSAQSVGLTVAPSARGFVFNADAETLVRFLDFGTTGTVGKLM